MSVADSGIDRLSPPLGRPARWRWLVLWALLLVAQVCLLSNNAALDSLTWRTTRWFTGDKSGYSWALYKAKHASDPAAPFYQRIDPPMARSQHGVLEARFYKRTESMWRVLRDLGEPLITVVLVVAVSIYDRRRIRAGIILFAGTAAAGAMGWLIRITMGRFRPDHGLLDGGNAWQLFRGFHEGSDLSWPSGHATLAFATAAVLTYLSPRGRWLFIPIAVGCAMARVVMGAHFWSDAIFGSVLGWSVAWWVAAAVDRMGRERDSIVSP